MSTRLSLLKGHHKLKLTRIKFTKGRFRLASEADEGLVSKWTRSFHNEVFSSANRSEPMHERIQVLGKGGGYICGPDIQFYLTYLLKMS